MSKIAQSPLIMALALILILFVSSCKKDAQPNLTQTAVNTIANAVPRQMALASSILGETHLKLSTPISLYNKSNITISGDSINGGILPCIQLTNCTNIHITKCRITNSSNYGILIGSGCSNILIDSCYITNVAGGVFAVGCPNGSIRVNSNQMLNMRGPFPKGDFVQFSNVGGHNNRIQYNICENVPGQSNPEDGISIYKSNGVAGDPILINGNTIKGGGPSTTGAGITVGDQGGSYILAENNTVVNTGSMGMQVAGGHDIQLYNNTISSIAFPWSHVGLGSGNYSGQASYNITINANRVYWISGLPADQLKGSKSIEKDAHYQAGTPMPTGWLTNKLGPSAMTNSPSISIPAATVQITQPVRSSFGYTLKYSAPISLTGAHNLIISGDSINGGTVPCITLINCSNITIKHCKLGNSTNLGIYVTGCTSVMVDSNYVTNVSTGVYAVNSKSIQVEHNQMKNMRGPYPRGSFVQFDNVTGTYNRVLSNQLENISGSSNPEDAISMFKSSGTSADPIYIINNWIRGGGPSKTGGGIMLGDNGGSYQVAEYNTLVNPGQYGAAVSGGTNMQLIGNKIYSTAESFSNVGLYYWNQSGLPSSAINISNNRVNFTSGQYGLNNFFLGAGNATPTGWSTNVYDPTVLPTSLPATIITW